MTSLDKIKENLISAYGVKGTLDKLALLSGYERTVPDILTFLDDPYYLGKILVDADGKSSVYPIWRKAACELYPTPYTTSAVEVYLTGG